MRVLVTGAARAIGRATVEVLAARGHEVVATARDVGAARRAAGGAGAAARRQRRRVGADRGRGRAGELDAVVNNAGLTGLRARSRRIRSTRSPGCSR